MTAEEYIDTKREVHWDRSIEPVVKLSEALKAIKMARAELIALLDAEKEETSIGLCEYDAGHENGRMEVIMSLTEKIKAL